MPSTTCATCALLLLPILMRMRITAPMIIVCLSQCLVTNHWVALQQLQHDDICVTSRPPTKRIVVCFQSLKPWNSYLRKCMACKICSVMSSIYMIWLSNKSRLTLLTWTAAKGRQPMGCICRKIVDPGPPLLLLSIPSYQLVFHIESCYQSQDFQKAWLARFYQSV